MAEQQIGKMSLLEHIVCAMEDLNDENFLDDENKAKKLVEKARGISELAKVYVDVLKTQQDEKKIKLEEKRVFLEGVKVASETGYFVKDFAPIGLEVCKVNEN